MALKSPLVPSPGAAMSSVFSPYSDSSTSPPLSKSPRFVIMYVSMLIPARPPDLLTQLASAKVYLKVSPRLCSAATSLLLLAPVEIIVVAL